MSHPYLVQAIAKSQPSDNTLRVGTVVSLDGTTLKVAINGGNVDTGYLANFDPAVGQTVAVLRESAGWMTIGPIQGPASPPDTVPPSISQGLLGVNYWTGGTAVSGGASETAMAAWTAEDTFRFQDGRLYRWTMMAGYFDTNGVAHVGNGRIRKGVGSTAGQELGLWRVGTAPNLGNQVVQQVHCGYIKNTTGGVVSTRIGASIHRVASGGAGANMGMYGDAGIRMTLEIMDVGAVASFATLAAISTSIT